MTNIQKRTIAKTADNLISWVAIITIFLLPVFFIPQAADLFDLAKRLLLAFSASTILLLWMARNIATKTFRITVTPFTLPLLIFALVSLASSFSNLPQMIEAFITTNSTIVFLGLFFITATTSRALVHKTQSLLNAFVLGGLTLAILTILETIGFGPTYFLSLLDPNIATDSDIFISLAGSVTTLTAILIPALIVSTFTAASRKQNLQKAFFFLSSAVITAAMVISVFTILPGKTNSPTFLPLSTSWEIAAENIKSPKAFLIGVGTHNFVSAFSANKPIIFNSQEFWNTRFAAARNFPLHVFTTTGIIGLISLALIALALFKIAKDWNQLTTNAKTALAAAASLLVITLLIPANTLILAMFVSLLIIISLELKLQRTPKTSELILKLFAAKLVNSNTDHSDDSQKDQSELLPLIIGIPLGLISLGAVFGSYRVLAADIAFKNSLQAAAANDGGQTYDLQRQAVTLNPYLSSYHRSYASTNLAVANALGSQEELTDQNRADITTLVQQSIREAKLTVQINPNDPANWETLAAIYRNLINVAGGAVDWSTASYVEVIRRDPNNPRLRIELGGIYYQLEDYQSATRLFSQAVELKPDWPNAHYNLANAYARNEELERAIASYDAVLTLIDPNTPDYATALTEQNQLKALLGEEQTEPEAPETGELTSPDPLPTPLPENQQLQLNEKEAAPPSTQGGFNEITQPTPTPEP